MAPTSNSVFPVFKSFARINSLQRAKETTAFFDCKFYPYTEPGVDPVFAVVGKAETIVCRPAKGDNGGVEIIAWFHDDDPDCDLNSCTWSQDLETGDPLLCVAGRFVHGESARIRIFNVREKKLVRTLIGHGKEIDDLAISPLSPSILASASMDYSVLFWSLDPAHERQPCMLMCGGEGHKEGLLTMAFHDSGRYLLTGGMDNMVNLWVIPDLPNADTGSDKPTMLHYPHFSSSAVHTNFVDCVVWYNDLILSKCAEECKIVLWRIENFSSADEAEHLTLEPPTTHEYKATRSAFGGAYQRLLQFDAPETNPFYMRFSLFTAPQKHPILFIGNEKSKVYFWDLQALEEYVGRDNDSDYENFFADSPAASATGSTSRGRGANRKRGGRRGGGAGKIQREASIASASTGATPLPGGGDEAQRQLFRSKANAHKYSTDDPFRSLSAHASLVVPRINFAARQVAWSVGGEWMVLVGDEGMIVQFSRSKEAR